MPSKPAADDGPDPIRPEDLTAMSTMTRIADRASRLASRVVASSPVPAAAPVPIAASVPSAASVPAAAPTVPTAVTEQATAAQLHQVRVLLSEQNSVVGARLKLAKRLVMRGSRTFTHRLVAASRSLADAIELLETTHGAAIGELHRQAAAPFAAISAEAAAREAAREAEAARREAESARRDRDTQALASQITALELAQAKLRREHERSTDGLHGQLTNVELGLEDSTAATSSLEDSVRGLAGQLASLEKSFAHDRSEMHRTRTSLNRLVRTAAIDQPGSGERPDGDPVAHPNSASTAASGADPGAAETLDDDSYLDFELRFRGTRDEIRERQKDAIPLVSGLAGAGAPLLDLGCGRGEWLELARELDVPAYGVDLNASMVMEATRAGLDARVEDAVSHLANLRESTLQAVSAFHFVEHIPLPTLIKVLDSALLALRPGGTLLLETPNPTNLVVGAASFYLDPTHLRALHPDFLSFLVESRGFVDVEVHFVHPVIDEQVLQDGHIDGLVESTRLSRLVQGVEWALFGPQDYLLSARRAEVAR